MSNINLEEGKINFDGKWLSAEDLTEMIQKKMGDGDFKFAAMAAALEELNRAVEDSHIIEATIVLEKEIYEKLLALGGGDEKESLRKAIMEYIHDGEAPVSPQPQQPPQTKPKEKETTHLVEVEDKDEPAPKPEKIKEKEPSPDAPPKSGRAVRCTNCKTIIPVHTDERPIVVDCPQCRTTCRVTF